MVVATRAPTNEEGALGRSVLCEVVGHPWWDRRPQEQLSTLKLVVSFSRPFSGCPQALSPHTKELAGPLL